MPRAVPEWIGRTPDSAVPDRVRLRVFLAFGGKCQCGCGRKIVTGEPWELEDKIALINGGENRESNKRPFLKGHQSEKTKDDVAEKSEMYRVRLKHYGIKKKPKGRPMIGTKASGWSKTFNAGWVKRG